MSSKPKSTEYQVYVVTCYDDRGIHFLTWYEVDEHVVSTWKWSSDPRDAWLFDEHRDAYQVARDITDPEEGPVWKVRSGTLNLGRIL